MLVENEHVAKVIRCVWHIARMSGRPCRHRVPAGVAVQRARTAMLEPLEPRVLLSSSAATTIDATSLLEDAEPPPALQVQTFEAAAQTTTALFAAASASLDNNLQVVDLTDLDGDMPLDVVSTTQTLSVSEDWEHSTWQNPNWPQGGNVELGYPSVVKNDRGPNPDGKYYLFYAHHNPRSGIGVAVSNSITGPFSKNVNVPGRSDNQVVPAFHAGNPNPDDPDHTSSPWVVWNEDEQLWFLYFHYFNHLRQFLPGFQHTALATTPDLASHNWTIWTDPSTQAAPPYVPVLPATSDPWINESSSYNTVHRLPTGQWLAFLRGTSTVAGDPTKLGFATSNDGRNWNYFPENPIIHQNDGGGGRQGVYRPSFVGYLGPNGAGNDEYLVAWQESHPFDGDTRLIYGKTTDFKTVTRDPRGHVNWEGKDGPVSAWRQGDRLYLFSGDVVHEMVLPVSTQNSAPTKPGVPSASAVSSDRATVSWPASTDPDGDALTYAVRYRKTDLSTSWSSAVHTSNTQVTITGLDTDTSYNVRLRASDGQLTSPWRWATNLFTTTSFNSPPTRPGPVSALNVGSDAATIAWGASTDADSDPIIYGVQYRKDDLSDTWSATIWETNTTTILAGLAPQTSYRVRLRANDGQINSTWRRANDLFTTTSGGGTGAWPYVENFEDGQAQDFVPQTGNWSISNGGYELETSSEEAVSVLTVPSPLPAEFRIDATLSVQAGGSWKNGYVVFDHEGPRQFKVAAGVAGSNRWRFGHATSTSIVWDATVSQQVNLATAYGVRVEISGSVATLIVDGAALLTHDYGEVLSDGDLGLGSRRSHARFDDVVVQPTSQTIHSDDFEDGVADLFTPETGTWSVVGGSYQVQTQNQDTMSVLNLPRPLPGDFDLDVTLSVQSGGDWKNAYVIFDRVDATNYKIAAAVAGSNRWRLGQRTSAGLVWHQTLIQTITLDTNYQVRLSVRGSMATLSADGAVLLAHDYGEPLSDGALALASRRSHARFDDLVVTGG